MSRTRKHPTEILKTIKIKQKTHYYLKLAATKANKTINDYIDEILSTWEEFK